MSRAKNERDDMEVSRLLTAAAKAIARVRYCWLVTEAETGGVSARPMGRVLPGPNENDWNVRFVTDRRSRKASHIPRARHVAGIFPYDPDDSLPTFVASAAPPIQRASEAGPP